MKKTLIGIAGVLILALGVYMYMQNADAQMGKSIESMPTPVEQVSANINQYDMAEISKHATAADCWMSIEGKVYNVTSFVNSHPGGEKILKGCGTDATMLFNKIRAHAKGSVQALKSKFEIGTLIVK